MDRTRSKHQSSISLCLIIFASTLLHTGCARGKKIALSYTQVGQGENKEGGPSTSNPADSNASKKTSTNNNNNSGNQDNLFKVRSTCELSMLTPHEGGTIGSLIFQPGVNALGSQYAEIWDAANPSGPKLRIDPLTPRQVLVNPPGPIAHYIVRYNREPASVLHTCELIVPVNVPTGEMGGLGMMTVLGHIVSLELHIELRKKIQVQLNPICTQERRIWPKRVAYDVYSGGKEPLAGSDSLRIVFNIHSNGKLLFARLMPKEKGFFDGGYSQSVPKYLIHKLDPSAPVEVRLCIKEIPPQQILTESDFDCSGVAVERQLATGKPSGTKNYNYLVKNHSVYTREEILDGSKIDFWNHRGKNNDQSCISRYSPLVLDLLGNGIRTSSVERNGVYFDLTASGIDLRTGWVSGSDDALLVNDLDRSGWIESGAELFGEYTGSEYGERTFGNGFLALQALDSNHDGRFSPLDSAWSDVKLWLASDFKTLSNYQRPVLQSLDDIRISGRQLKIESIDLNFLESVSQSNGNITQFVSQFSVRDALKIFPRTVADIWFSVK